MLRVHTNNSALVSIKYSLFHLIQNISSNSELLFSCIRLDSLSCLESSVPQKRNLN